MKKPKAPSKLKGTKRSASPSFDSPATSSARLSPATSSARSSPATSSTRSSPVTSSARSSLGLIVTPSATLPSILPLTDLSYDSTDVTATKGTSFEDYGLSRDLVKGIFEQEWEVPSPIQEALLEVALKGQDILARAKNETGKTGAYCIPCIQKIDIELEAIQALIVVPTHELVLQTSQTCDELSKHINTSILGTSDETDLKKDLEFLNKEVVHLVIGTPGRILKLICKDAAKMDHCKIIVLDEADELLSQNSESMLDRLIAHLPMERQVMLYSATFTNSVSNFAINHLNRPFEFGLMKAESSEEMQIVAQYSQSSREELTTGLNATNFSSAFDEADELIENDSAPLAPIVPSTSFDSSNKLASYIKRSLLALTDESIEKLVDDALDKASDSIKQFAESDELRVLVVSRLGSIDELPDSGPNSCHVYSVELKFTYNRSHDLAIVFIKEGASTIDLSKPFSEQLNVITFNSYESIQTRIEKVLLSYFESKDHLNQFISKEIEEAIVPQDFDYTSIGEPTLQHGNPKKARVFGKKVKCEELVLEMGDLIWNGQLYRDVRFKYLQYDEPKSDAAKGARHYKSCCCPFPQCNVVNQSSSELLKHVKKHIGSSNGQTPTVFCVFCKASCTGWALKNKHFPCCQPRLSSGQIDNIIDLSKAEKLLFSDVRQLATAFWNSKFSALNARDFDFHGTAKHYKTYFAGFFKKTDDSKEFKQLIDEWCKSGENGVVYLYIEITNGIPVLKQLPKRGRYIGSTNNYATRSSHHNTFHGVNIDKTTRFYTHLIKAINEEKRKFVRVKVMDNIVEEHRYAIESAFKRLIEGISPITWNCRPVSRPKDCVTRSWTYEKELMFAGHILQRNWNSIKTQLEDKSNIIILK